MAGSKTGGVTIELQEQSKNNLMLQMDKLKKLAPESAFKMLVTLLFDIKTLAQLKLKADGHIKTSRLRNSIYVQTLGQKYAMLPNNTESYIADGKTYKSELQIDLKNKEGAVGTNVDYAAAIEYGYGSHEISVKRSKVLGTPKIGFFGKKVTHPGFAGDSFLYWALKHIDVDKRAREISKEILNGVK